MNFLYQKDRKFALDFMRQYKNKYLDAFDTYNCCFDLFCKPIHFTKKTVRYWIIQIHSFEIKENDIN